MGSNEFARLAPAPYSLGGYYSQHSPEELLSSLVFEACRSCGDLAGFGSFNSVFERNACDDFGEVVKAA